MSNVMFTCTALAGTNKQGILVPDANGYYSQPVGALRVFNSAGHFYTDNQKAVDIFKSSSAFVRRVKNGDVMGEVDHPEWPKGMTEDEYAARMYYLDPKNECVHFSDFTLDFDNFKGDDGRPIVAIIGSFTPSGIHGAMLEKKLKNPKQNVNFSIRAFTVDEHIGRTRYRTLAEVLTFDHVSEPGLNNARKFKSLTLESMYERPVTKAGLEKALNRQVLNLARESIAIDRDGLFRSLGWAVPTQTGITANW